MYYTSTVNLNILTRIRRSFLSSGALAKDGSEGGKGACDIK